MTNRLDSPAVRRAARLLALTPAILVTGVTGAAFADAPQQWEDSPPVNSARAVLLLGGIPVLLFLLITLLVYLPSMSKGASYHPGEAWRNEPEWFGGPRDGIEAADRADRPAVGSDTSEPAQGGASGRW